MTLYVCVCRYTFGVCFQFDNEIEKVHEAYESLVKHSQKRESLEKAMRCKLEANVNTLKHNNQLLKGEPQTQRKHSTRITSLWVTLPFDWQLLFF